MAKTQTTKINCADFGLGKLLFAPIDGQDHAPLVCYSTPSAVIRANRLPDDISGFAVAYFSARSQGLFEALGFEETGNVEEDVLNFFDRYCAITADDVENAGTEGEQNPTK